MKRLEPAEVIWAGLIATGVAASGVLIETGRKPLTMVAREHPLAILYFVCHFLGLWPKPIDPISAAHGAYSRRRAVRVTTPAGSALVVPVAPSSPRPGGRRPGSTRHVPRPAR